MPKKNTVTPRFVLGKHSGIKPQTIYLKLEWRGQRIEYSLKESISPKYWNKKKGEPKPANSQTKESTKFQCDRIRKRILEVRDVVELIYAQHGLDITKYKVLSILDEKLRGKGKKATTLFEYFPQYIERIRSKEKVQPNTLKSYQTVWRRFQLFVKDQRQQYDFADITEDWRDGFIEWHEEHDYAPNTIAKTISTLLTVIEHARTKGLHNNLEYQAKGFRLPYTPSFNMRLTFAELDHLMRLDNLNEYQERARDAFVLSCYTGLRHSDMIRIEPRHFKKRKDGPILDIVTNKTGKRLYIPLKPIAAKILEQHDYYSPCTIAPQKYNNYLKEIGKAAGFFDDLVVKTKGKEFKREKWREMKSHVARRSFATNFYEADYPIKTLMAITGHSSEKMFKTYVGTEQIEAVKDFHNQDSNLKIVS